MSIKKPLLVEEKPGSVKSGQGVVIASFPGYFLLACIVVAGYFLLQVFQPFITILIFSAILATAFFPLYKKVLSALKGRERVSSFITCLLVLFLIIVPLLFFIFLLGRQAGDTFVFVQQNVQNGSLDGLLKWENGGVIYDSLGFAREYLGDFVDIDSLNLRESIVDVAKTVTSVLAQQSANILKGALWLLISTFIMFFSMYYLFKDHEYIMDRVMTLSPLPDRHEQALFRKFKEISLATLYGIFLTAFIQGIIGGIGFFIAGVPNVLFWGTAIAFFSLVPILGTSIIWFPASLFLLASGNIFGGLFLMAWGGLLVSTVDNFLRAYLIGGRTKMNQLLMFLSIFGGVWAFKGLIGIIFGPLILTFFFAFLHIYESEYDKVLHHGK